MKNNNSTSLTPEGRLLSLDFLPRLAFCFTHAYPMIALSTVQTLKKIKMEPEDPSLRYGLHLSRLHLLSFPLVSMYRKTKHKLFTTPKTQITGTNVKGYILSIFPIILHGFTPISE